jgi:hypothetical protein
MTTAGRFESEAATMRNGLKLRASRRKGGFFTRLNESELK